MLAVRKLHSTQPSNRSALGVSQIRRQRSFRVRMSLYVGLDCGTQSTKCLIYDEVKRTVVARGSAQHTLIQDRKGQAEQHPQQWLAACKTAIAEALQTCTDRVGEIKAIGVSGQQHGCVVLDADKQVIRPAKLWSDVESADEAEALSKQFGFTVVPSFTVTKLLWLKNHEPENYAKVAHILLPHDYLNFHMTGHLIMEASDASGTGVFDSTKRTWNLEHMALVDEKLQHCFPSLLESANEAVGTLLPDVAQEWGLPAGIPVAPGGGDNAMSALGAGAVEEGTWIISLGTSGTLFGPSNKPILDPTGTICPFCDAAGKWLPLLCTLNCTGVVEEVKHSYNLDHAQLTELARKQPAGCEGVTFLPYLNGERTPNWPHATGAMLGLRPGLLKPGLLYRAAMEGATFSLLAGLQSLQAYGLRASKLLVVGGGSKNLLWRQIIADSFQLPLMFPCEPESAALGAALQAGAIGNGVSIEEYVKQHSPPVEEQVCEPNTDIKEQYEEAFKRHVDWGRELFGGGTSTV